MFEGFFVLYGLIVQLDRTLVYETKNEGSNPSGTTSDTNIFYNFVV